MNIINVPNFGKLFKKRTERVKQSKDKMKLDLKLGNFYKKGLGSIKMSRHKSAWGLEIGDKELKAAKVSFHDGELLVEAVDRIEYSSINQEKKLEKAELIEGAVNVFVERNLIKKTDKIIASISGRTVLSRFISLPPMKKGRIPEAIKFELRKQIPFLPSEIVWDSYQFEDNIKGEKGTEVGLFATKKENIFGLLPSLVSIKMNLEAIQVTSIAIYNLIRMCSDLDKDVIVINVEKGNTDFMVVGKSKFWNRNFSISEVNIDLVREIQRSIGYYVSISKDAKPENVFLMGEVFEDDKKIKFVNENLEGDVTFLNLLNKISLSEDVDSSILNEKNIHSFGAALGLAVQGIGQGKINTNLLPLDYIKERQVPKRRALAYAITVLIFLGILTQSIKDYVAWRKLSSFAETIKSTHDEVKRLEMVYRKVVKEVKEEGDKLQSLALIGKHGSFWIEAIRKVIEIMPEKVYLLSMESLWGVSYADSKEDKGKKKKSSKKIDGSEKVLIMNIKGESYDSRMSYIEEMVKKPLEEVKLFDQQISAFRSVEIVQGSLHHVKTFTKKNGHIGLDINQSEQPIAFEIRWIVSAIN